MKRLDSREVDAKTVQRLLTSKNGQLRPRTPRASTFLMYLLDDGSALVVSPNGTGRHWTSYDELMAQCRALQEAENTEGGGFADLLSAGKDFIERVPQLVAALPRLIDVDASTLDATESSIDAIDTAIDAAGPEPFLTADVFQSLVAYVGEVIRPAIGGRWELRSPDDGRTWEPDVIDARGERCNLLRVYKEM